MNDPTVVIKEVVPGVRLFVDLSDHVIGLNIVRGRYEREEAAFARHVLKPGDVAVDIGSKGVQFGIRIDRGTDLKTRLALDR